MVLRAVGAADCDPVSAAGRNSIRPGNRGRVSARRSDAVSAAGRNAVGSAGGDSVRA